MSGNPSKSAFCESGVGHFQWIFDREGGITH